MALMWPQPYEKLLNAVTSPKREKSLNLFVELLVNNSHWTAVWIKAKRFVKYNKRLNKGRGVVILLRTGRQGGPNPIHTPLPTHMYKKHLKGSFSTTQWVRIFCSSRLKTCDVFVIIDAVFYILGLLFTDELRRVEFNYFLIKNYV